MLVRTLRVEFRKEISVQSHVQTYQDSLQVQPIALPQWVRQVSPPCQLLSVLLYETNCMIRTLYSATMA